MAVSVTKNLTDLWNSESTTGWTGISTTLYSGFNREGSNCEGFSVSNTTSHGYRSFTAIDFTAAASGCIYIWMVSYGQIDTFANGGIRIVVGDGTNRAAYYVGGSDYLPFGVNGWYCFMLDPNNLPTNFATLAGTESSIDWTSITDIGIGFKTLSKALGGADNCFVDMARYGTGITIGGGGSGTEGTFLEVANDDASTASGKAYGIIREIQPGVYGIQGQVEFGDSGTGNSYFLDKDAIVIFEDNGAGDSFYKFSLVANSTGTNSFVLGVKQGTGDTALGANGVTIQSSGPGVTFDLDATNFNTVNMYGGKLYNINDSINLSTNTAHEFIGVTVDQSTQVVANQCVIRNCTFSGHSGTDAALLWNSTINIKYCAFNGNSDATNNPAGIEHTATGVTVSYVGLTFSGNDNDVYISATSGTLTINASEGSNVSDTNYRAEGTATLTVNNTVNVTLSPLVNNTEVRIYDHTTSNPQTELDGIENTSTGSFSFSLNAGTAVDIVIMHKEYVEIRTNNYIVPTSTTTIPINQQIDRNYNNP